MKELLVQFADYNYWANKRITDVVVNLADDQLNKEISSSFKSIFDTMVHLWDVEYIWWQRMKLMDIGDWPGVHFKGSIVELNENLLHQSKQWKDWVNIATEAALNHEFIYRNSKKEQFKQPVWQALQHLFNHQTFHRGQLITMLRQAGVTELPVTDLIAYSRKK